MVQVDKDIVKIDKEMVMMVQVLQEMVKVNKKMVVEKVHVYLNNCLNTFPYAGIHF